MNEAGIESVHVQGPRHTPHLDRTGLYDTSRVILQPDETLVEDSVARGSLWMRHARTRRPSQYRPRRRVHVLAAGFPCKCGPHGGTEGDNGSRDMEQGSQSHGSRQRNALSVSRRLPSNADRKELVHFVVELLYDLIFSLCRPYSRVRLKLQNTSQVYHGQVSNPSPYISRTEPEGEKENKKLSTDNQSTGRLHTEFQCATQMVHKPTSQLRKSNTGKPSNLKHARLASPDPLIL